MAILQGLWDILIDTNRYLVSDLEGTFVPTAPETVVDYTRHYSRTMLSVRIYIRTRAKADRECLGS